MCRGLLDTHPVFAASIERTDRELARYTDWSLLEELRRDEAESRMSETEIAQPANFAVQIALAEQLAEYGIVPDAVIGHSAGEVAAHHLAGLLTFEQAVAVIYHRSRLQQRTTGMGRMLAVGLSADTLMATLDADAVAEFGRRVSIAAINSPFAVTVAGDEDVLAGIVRQLDEAEVFNRYLAVKVPYHTHYMDLVRDDLFTAFDGLSSAPGRIPLYSTVTGERLTEYAAGAAYWWQNTRATVLSKPPHAGCSTTDTPTSSSSGRIPCWRRRSSRSPDRRASQWWRPNGEATTTLARCWAAWRRCTATATTSSGRHSIPAAVW